MEELAKNGKDKTEEISVEEVSEEVVEILPNLKIRLEACPRCDYRRQPWDEKYVSAFECPKCGVMYALALEEQKRLNRGQQLKDEAEAELRRQAEEMQKTIGKGISGAMFAGEERPWVWGVAALAIILLLGCVFFLW